MKHVLVTLGYLKKTMCSGSYRAPTQMQRQHATFQNASAQIQPLCNRHQAFHGVHREKDFSSSALCLVQNSLQWGNVYCIALPCCESFFRGNDKQ